MTPPIARAIARLLSAAALCLAFVVSQMAHARPPSSMGGPSPAMTAVHAMMPMAAREAGRMTDHERHAGGGLDRKCAVQCPSVFVQPEGSAAARTWRGGERLDVAAAPLVGTIVPAQERPPRA